MKWPILARLWLFQSVLVSYHIKLCNFNYISVLARCSTSVYSVTVQSLIFDYLYQFNLYNCTYTCKPYTRQLTYTPSLFYYAIKIYGCVFLLLNVMRNPKLSRILVNVVVLSDWVVIWLSLQLTTVYTNILFLWRGWDQSLYLHILNSTVIVKSKPV